MTITTPSGYVVDFKDESELTYGDRRQVQRSMMRSYKLEEGKRQFTGEVIFDGQDEMLKVLLKSIKRPDGTIVSGDLFAEVMSWKLAADGDAVFEVVKNLESPKG